MALSPLGKGWTATGVFFSRGGPGEGVWTCALPREADGGREGIRTLDLSVANAALSQLSYAPTPLAATLQI